MIVSTAKSYGSMTLLTILHGWQQTLQQVLDQGGQLMEALIRCVQEQKFCLRLPTIMVTKIFGGMIASMRQFGVQLIFPTPTYNLTDTMSGIMASWPMALSP